MHLHGEVVDGDLHGVLVRHVKLVDGDLHELLVQYEDLCVLVDDVQLANDELVDDEQLVNDELVDDELEYDVQLVRDEILVQREDLCEDLYELSVRCEE